jgi:GNAT superfamily N-acetyltransferase
MVREVGGSACIAALTANERHYWAYRGRASGLDVRDDGQFTWLSAHLPTSYYNRILRADLASGDIDDAIAGALDWFDRRGDPEVMRWAVGPDTGPADLGLRLQRHALSLRSRTPGMAMELASLPPAVPMPPGVVVEAVCDEAGLRDWTTVILAAFGIHASVDGALLDIDGRLGLEPRGPVRHFVARLAGQPVACSSSFLSDGVAGIYWVGTLEAARRQGVGSAMTLAPLLEARALGYQVGVLGSSRLGRSVYERLGFRQVCTTEVYVRS